MLHRAPSASVSRYGRWLAASALIVGGITAAYMTYESLRYLKTGENTARLCSFSKWVNCDASVTSPYAFVLGVPIAWIALLFFVSIGFLLGLAKWLPRWRAAVLPAAMTLGVAAAVVSGNMLTLEALKIKAVCLPCFLIQSSCFTLCVLLIQAFRRLERPILWSSALVLFLATQAAYSEGIAQFLEFQTRWLAPKPVDVAAEVQRYLDSPIAINDAELDRALAQPADSRIQIVCFVDYQCPECRRVAVFLPAWLGQLREKCHIIQLQFPLDASVNPYKPRGGHLQAGLAAKAAICFDRLGISDALETRMFESQTNLSLPVLLGLAAEAGVNTNSFLRMINSGEVKDVLMRHLELAHAAGVSATPTLLIDGRAVAAYYEPAVLRGIVATEMNRRQLE